MKDEFLLQPESRPLNWSPLLRDFGRLTVSLVFLWLFIAVLHSEPSPGYAVSTLLWLMVGLTILWALYFGFISGSKIYRRKYCPSSVEKEYSICIEEKTLELKQDDKSTCIVPFDSVKKIIKRSVQSGNKEFDIGFELTDLYEVKLKDDEKYKEFAERHDREGIHILYWTSIIGNLSKQKEFEEWLRHHFSDQVQWEEKNVKTSPDWNSIDWMVVVLLICLLVGLERGILSQTEPWILAIVLSILFGSIAWKWYMQYSEILS